MSQNHSGTHHVSLFVPELLSGLQFLKDLPKSEIPQLPALQLLLTRASLNKEGFKNFYQGVCTLSGLNVQQQDQPIAAIAVAVDKKLNSKTNADYFLYAEPVVMKADRDSVVLLESLRPNVSINSLSIEESQSLITEINLHFKDEPWQLNLTSQGEWYLKLNSYSAISTTNIASVLCNHAQAHLPKGDDVQYWRKIINEIEMLLFSSKVNQARIDSGKPTVISLWLWGGGVIPNVVSSDEGYVICGESEFLKTIAEFISTPFISLHNKVISELFLSQDFSHIVIVDAALETYWQRRDLYAWLETLKELEISLFKPLLQNLRQGNIDSVNLYPNSDNKFNMTTRNVKRWWQPVKTLPSLSTLL
jgi:hypothetical protein